MYMSSWLSNSSAVMPTFDPPRPLPPRPRPPRPLWNRLPPLLPRPPLPPLPYQVCLSHLEIWNIHATRPMVTPKAAVHQTHKLSWKPPRPRPPRSPKLPLPRPRPLNPPPRGLPPNPPPCLIGCPNPPRPRPLEVMPSPPPRAMDPPLGAPPPPRWPLTPPLSPRLNPLPPPRPLTAFMFRRAFTFVCPSRCFRLAFLIFSAACTVGLLAICWASLRLAEDACCAAAILALMAWGEVGELGVLTMLVNLQTRRQN